MELDISNYKPEAFLFFPLVFNVIITFTAYAWIADVFAGQSINQIAQQVYNAPMLLPYVPCNMEQCGINFNSITYTFLPPAIQTAFKALQSGDFLGFLSGLFSAFAQASNLFAAAISLVAGSILLFMASGIAASALGSGVSINEQGTRLAQSIGLALFLMAFTQFFFGNWINLLPSVLQLLIIAVEYVSIAVGAVLRAVEIA